MVTYAEGFINTNYATYTITMLYVISFYRFSAFRLYSNTIHNLVVTDGLFPLYVPSAQWNVSPEDFILTAVSPNCGFSRVSSGIITITTDMCGSNPKD